MIWQTAPNLHLDRAACVWLVKRFVDSSAEFELTEAPTESDPGARSFGYSDSELVGRDGSTTFSAIVTHFDLADDAALQYVSRVVQEATTTWRGGALSAEALPEEAGIRALADGLFLSAANDSTAVASAIAIYDCLYAYAWFELRREQGTSPRTQQLKALRPSFQREAFFPRAS